MTFGKVNNIDSFGYTKQEIDKIGNTLIYLKNKLGHLTKTQSLKFLYFLDEFSIKKYGIPFIGLKYEVWQFGPVSQDVFVELDEDQPQMLKDYISIKREDFQHYKFLYVKPLKDFNDDEFSDNDINLMNLVIDKFGNYTSSQLSDLTHEPGSLWYNIAKEEGLLESFKNRRLRTSNFTIDFTPLLDEEKSKIYKLHQENQLINRQYS
jgi:uncharacterized phage-associated protein